MQNNKLFKSFWQIISVAFFIIFTATVLAASDLAPTNKHYAEKVAKFYGLPSAQNLVLLGVEGYQQTTDTTCGQATVMSLLEYYHLLSKKQMNAKEELQLAAEMGTYAKRYTTPEEIANWLRKHNFDVKLGTNGNLELLLKNIKQGIPVIVEWIDWGGHWVVVAGYSKADKNHHESLDNIFLADPAVHFASNKYINGISVFNTDRFESMWFDAQYFNPGHLVKGVYIIAVPKKGQTPYV